MARGGKRPGAGRPQILSDEECISVGQYCEKLLKEAVTARLNKEIYENTVNLRKEVQSCVNELGDSKDQKEHRQKNLNNPTGLLSRFPVVMSDEDVKDVLRLDKGLVEDREPARLLRFAVKRPQVRAEILDQVAAEKGLKPGTVDKCWKKYRKFEIETRS